MAEAPARVSEVHQQFSEQLWSLSEKRDITLYLSDSAPAVVTIINSSRVVSDIRRDLGRVKSKPSILQWKVIISNIADLQTEKIMLVVIKSTDDPSCHNPTLSFSEDRRVQSIRFLLVDRKYSQLLHCNYNTQTLQAVLQFLSSNN